MKTKHNYYSESEQHIINFAAGFDSIAKVLLDNQITIKNILFSFQVSLIKACIENEPGITNNEISLKTGIDRRTISSIKSGKFEKSNKKDKYSLFISELKTFQETNNDGFPITLLQYRKLFKTHLNGSNTPDVTLEYLIKEGYVKRKDDMLNVLHYGRTKAVDNVTIMKHLANLIERAVNVKYLNKSPNINIMDNAVIFRDIPKDVIGDLDPIILQWNRKIKKEFIQLVEPFCNDREKINGGCLDEYGMYFLNFRKQ